MRQPESPVKQHEGKAFAELHRGSGRWPLQRHPCDIEPPFDPWDRASVSQWDCWVNDWEGAWAVGILGYRTATPRILPGGSTITLPPVDWGHDYRHLVPIVVEQFPDDEATIPKAQQLLLSMPAIYRPVSFEVIGLGPCTGQNGNQPESTKPRIVVQFVVDRGDLENVHHQLLTHYPNSAVLRDKNLSEKGPHDKDMVCAYQLRENSGHAASFCLAEGYCWSLRRLSYLDTDPLAVVTAAMDHLEDHEWAMVQVLFKPSENQWAHTLRSVMADPFCPGRMIFRDISHKVLDEKFSSPLFAVSIRILASQPHVYRHLLGWIEQFSAPPQLLTTTDDDTEDEFPHSIAARCCYRPGMLLNVEELASIVHLPAKSVISTRLERIKTRTRPAPVEVSEAVGVVLGENIHRGEKRAARIPPALRARHCYVAGASGTGKSTLLLNMILQDIQAGQGVGLLDPHGDLVNAVLRRIPKDRVDDVILFDPSDEEFPFALNILEAKDESERERIVNETVMSLERYCPASWGPRLERILTYTIYTALEAITGATLGDIERMLTDPIFRDEVVGRATSPRLLQFWQNEFSYFPKNAVDPVLNKLSVFLMSRTVRNIICQRNSAINFDEVINGGKILLANLSTGLLTEKIAGTFGSFLVTKIVNAAFRRARLPEHQRRPWYLYVDEFQAFMNLSVGFDRILAEARKYNLVLAGLANQYVGQLSPAVRQAIFGNVGVMVVFRLGVDDASIAAKEMGVFTAEEILNLELGEAIARAGGSATAFNIRTHPPCAPPSENWSACILARNREQFAQPRSVVEMQFATSPSQNAPSVGTHSKSGGKRRRSPRSDEIMDPADDDLVT
jgi:hypothetical protein